MVKEFGDYRETLPKEWKKKYPNEHLQEIMADPALWFLCPSPNSSDGKKILKRNDPLFQFCMKLDDFEYAIEPVDGFLFELVPGNVMRQGIGISTNTDLDMLEVDLYFFPCDYTANPKRKLGVHALRVPVFSTRNTDIIDGIVRTFFPGSEKSVVIPFSDECFAELEGDFIDDYKTVSSICRKAVSKGTEQEKKNCRKFLDFIRFVGLEK